MHTAESILRAAFDDGRKHGEMNMFASVRRRPTVIVASLTLALLMLAILLLGPVDQAQAGTLLKLSPDELDRLASKVLAAQVVGTYSREVGSAGSGGSQGYIETVVELRVLQGLKGVPQSRGETMTIVVPGGTVGGLTMVVDTAPPFRVGEAVKLHLDGKGRVVGGFQGKHWLTVTEAALYGAEPGALLEGETSAIESGTSDATVSGITPSSGSAGTGTLVAVSGSGFGSTKGTGKVEFTYKGTTMIEATDVRSWSDTQIVCAIPVDYDGYSRSAGSGPVKVTTGTGATVTYSSFSVTFGYGQVKWSGASTAYKVNSNTADTTGEEALVDAAAATWNAASSFQFIDEGPTDITESTYLDSVNAVYWTTLEDGVLGRNTYWFVGSTLIAFDVAMNDIYAWGTGASGTYDIQSIATHELGHALNLRDLYGDPDSNKIMYGYGSPGQVKRALSAGDIEGIQWIYGGGTPPTYTLTTNVVGSGTINVNPQQATYTSGTPVTLTATPASGWQFNGWSGAVTGSTNPVTITMDANKTVTATFTEVGAPGTVTRYEQNHACCQYAGSWTTYASSLYSGGSYSYTKTAGASVTVTFNGTAIDYIATKSSTQGSAQIILDGVNKGTVSLY
ncbi:MAG: matrixin family metalloprotease, partial [Thermoleophilia bacterium]|nr:matrixin family metalloprotease [Thermoleophilia bacterium]